MSEEIKFEPVFGDQSLFDGAPEECILAVRMPGGDPVFYLEKNKSELRGNVAIPKYGFIKLAMRRIIKEPEQWTLEDKKAGRLPEVGCKCVWVNLSGTESPDDLLYPEAGEEIEIVANTKTYDGKYQVSVFKWLHDDGETQCYAASGHVEDFKPIETPAEKAQREEDEFVVAMLDAASLEQLMFGGFKSGVIAAYRKLKGGE